MRVGRAQAARRAYAAWNPASALAHVRAWAGRRPDLGDDPDVRRAFTEGTSWLAGQTLDRLRAHAAPPVLGLADGNLANYLWDSGAARVRLVDWEDSGRADRAFELAEVTRRAPSPGRPSVCSLSSDRNFHRAPHLSLAS